MDSPRLPRLAIVAFALLMGACMTPKVTADHDPTADFSKLHTFQWLDGEQKRTGALRMGPEAVDGLIRDVVERELSGKGITPQADGAPDFLLRYHAAVGTEILVATVSRDAGGSTRSLPVRHDVGTLVIDVVEPDGQRVIWQASLQAEVDRYLPREKRRERLTGFVHRMFESFPPK